MTATPLQGASARGRSPNRRRTSTMPYWQHQLHPPQQSAPLHRVLPPRSLVLLAGLAMLLVAVLIAAG
jgi:hypothetical protein